MKLNFSPVWLVVSAFVLLLLGFIVPLLMVLQVIESTLFLNFFSYFVILLGSILGFVGTAFLVVRWRRK